MILIEEKKLSKFKKGCFKNMCMSWPSGDLLEFLKKEMTGPYRRKYLGYAIWVVTTAPTPTKTDMESKRFFLSYINKNLKVCDKFKGDEERLVLGC